MLEETLKKLRIKDSQFDSRLLFTVGVSLISLSACMFIFVPKMAVCGRWGEGAFMAYIVLMSHTGEGKKATARQNLFLIVGI